MIKSMKPNHMTDTDLARLLYQSILWASRDPRPRSLRVAREHARAYDTARWAYEALSRRLKEPATKLGTTQRWDDPSAWGVRTRELVRQVAEKDEKGDAWQAWASRL